MPHLRLAGRLPPIDIDKIAGLFNLPLLNVAIVVKDFQSMADHPSELAQLSGLAEREELGSNRLRVAARGAAG